ncbi:cytochrome P450 [Armillaria gallica]|uniref:Cytochrome P450 n=1 Tax=Armillaria gallica TaxID=47427 RepID=A0A2H3CGG6_ARMGA|nr:cytochrome P450 [Armillaria gallica]
MLPSMNLNEYVNLVRQVDKALILHSLGITIVLLLAIQFRKVLTTRAKLKAIPTVGSSGIITSWIDAFKFVHHAKEIIQAGHQLYDGSAFKVPLLDKWMVVVSGPEKINDIRKSSTDQLSFMDANVDQLQTDYTVSRSISADPYHVEVIRGAFTRNIAACFADVQDEIRAAFSDHIPMTEDWIEVPAYQAALQIICRASNRMFIGLPLCRNQEYIDLNINHVINAFNCAYVLNLLPDFLKPIVAFFTTPRRRAVAKAEEFLGQNIRERLHQEDVHGKDWPGKPNDMLSWLLDASKGVKERRTVRELSIEMLGVNIGAIHTTTTAFTNALFVLAAHPECVETLRTEVESVTKEEGYTKAAMGKMIQLDSFLKETQRLYGDFGVFGMKRKARKDFAFSDGTVIPAGTQVAVVSWCTHLDEKNYEDPLEFKPWRFSERRKQEGEGIRHQMTTTSLDFIFFGHGRSACPGRFFAVNEMKALMCYVLMNFDVKIDKVPPSMWFSSEQFPNQSSRVSFRKRSYAA